jgi:HSP20 family protein
MFSLRTYRPLTAPEILDRVYDARLARRQAHLLPVDVRAEGDDFILTAAVPGLRAEDVQVEVLAERITIRAELPAPAADDAEASRRTATWLLQERRYGAFTRTLDFPVELDAAHAEATVENGLLTLRVPKAEAAKPKVIKVVSAK